MNWGAKRTVKDRSQCLYCGIGSTNNFVLASSGTEQSHECYIESKFVLSNSFGSPATQTPRHHGTVDQVAVCSAGFRAGRPDACLLRPKSVRRRSHHLGGDEHLTHEQGLVGCSWSVFGRAGKRMEGYHGGCQSKGRSYVRSTLAYGAVISCRHDSGSSACERIRPRVLLEGPQPSRVDTRRLGTVFTPPCRFGARNRRDYRGLPKSSGACHGCWLRRCRTARG